jgi:glucose/arabinose dehydrogenase/mono/diheme cytochrome c family protein
MIYRLKGFGSMSAAIAVPALAAAIAWPSVAPAAPDTAGRLSAACPGDSGGVTVSPGFCATIFADNLGHARHLAVAPNGVVYVNSWSGRYYHDDTPPQDGFLIALQDTTGVGHANVIRRFGETAAQGAAGGTGIALYKWALYAEVNDRIVRYALPIGDLVPESPPEVVVSGLPLTGDHPMHPFAIDAEGNLFIDLGSATNACQMENRMTVSPGIQPCTELETRAGIWRYDANKTGQKFSPAERFVTGLRNGEGISFDATGRIFGTQHGRDQLLQNWPKLYRPEQGPELPAEELVELRQGADYGWPECYFDGFQKKLVLAPEYGGNGGNAVGICAQKQAPVASFPAHWAPNDMLIYNGAQFPAPYHGGAFIAFHGSWNRAPAPQGGYNVVFQPLEDGKAAGNFIVFADGFAGAVKDPGRATARPTGLAVGPDGALYIADDVHGRIWRVTYVGGAATGLAPAPAPVVAAADGSNPLPPEGIHPDAGRSETASLPIPPGGTKEQIALGDRIFHGEVDGGTCSGCHGSDAKGSPMGANLVSGPWRKRDNNNSLEWITNTIVTGVPKPKNYPGAMPPMGGAQLSSQDVAAVAAYVWGVSHEEQ